MDSQCRLGQLTPDSEKRAWCTQRIKGKEKMFLVCMGSCGFPQTTKQWGGQAELPWHTWHCSHGSVSNGGSRKRVVAKSGGMARAEQNMVVYRARWSCRGGGEPVRLLGRQHAPSTSKEQVTLPLWLWALLFSSLPQSNPIPFPLWIDLKEFSDVGSGRFHTFTSVPSPSPSPTL